MTIPYTAITGKTAYLMRTYPSSTGLILGNAYLSGGNAVINYRNDSEYELNATIYVQIIHV